MALTATVGSYEGLPEHWVKKLKEIPKDAPFSYVAEVIKNLAVEDIKKRKREEYFAHSGKLTI